MEYRRNHARTGSKFPVCPAAQRSTVASEKIAKVSNGGIDPCHVIVWQNLRAVTTAHGSKLQPKKAHATSAEAFAIPFGRATKDAPKPQIRDLLRYARSVFVVSSRRDAAHTL